jgi:hypothetical protein
VKASDCASGLSCQEGFCTAPSASNPDSGTTGQDQPSLPGTLTQGSTGSQATWARTFPSLAGWIPDLVRGPHGEILVHVASQRLPRDYSALAYDDWLIRFDGATGEMLWIEKVVPSASMAVDAMGNIVLAWPSLLQKLDGDGSLLWSLPRTAQNGYESVRVVVDGDSNIVLARNELDGDPLHASQPKGFLALEKLTANGAPIWARQFGDGTSTLIDAIAAIDGANDIVLLAPWVEGAVDFGGGALSGKNVLAKFDAAGHHLWSKVVGGFASNYLQIGTPLVVDAANNIWLPNQVGGPVDIGLGPIFCTPQIVLKFDASGAPLWNKCFLVDYLAVLPDGGFVTSATLRDDYTLGGQHYSPVDDDDGWLARYDDAGTWLKTSCTPEPGYQTFGAIVPDGTGAFILVGASSGGLTLPGNMTLAPVADGVWTSFVAKIAAWN